MANVETVGQRFTQLIQAVGLSKNAFALSLDKTATVIQHIVEERNKPGFDLLCRVFEVYPNVSKDWLLQGVGQMYNQAEAAPRAVMPLAETVAPEILPTPAASDPLPAAERTAPIAAEEKEEPLVTASAPQAEAAPAMVPSPAAQSVAMPAAAPTPNWEAALYAQQLQHQLALAEQRNQHLLEQQKMLLEQQRMMQHMMEMLRPTR